MVGSKKGFNYRVILIAYYIRPFRGGGVDFYILLIINREEEDEQHQERRVVVLVLSASTPSISIV